MKILVTGGAGFIGSHIVDRYLELGHEVAVIDDLSVGKRENAAEKAKFYQADITDKKAVEEIIAKEKPEAINHHAAQKNVQVSTQEPSEDARINVLGGIYLLEAAQKRGVKKFIFASTGGAIYGETDDIPTPETNAAIPLSPYGIAKLSLENYIRFFANNGGPKSVILRYANVYGPRQDPEGEAGVISIFVDKLLSQGQPVIFGDGKQTRDFVYVGDVVEANVRALEAGEGKVINIATAKETTVVELYRAIREALSSNQEPKFEPPRAGEVTRSCLDISLAKNILGWEPKVDLTEGIKETVEFMKNR